MDDAALLHAAAEGDARAFEAFMHAHEAAVHRFLCTRMFAGAEVDDAMQETFIAAWRSASSYHGGGSARAWLYAIARNAVRHLVRRHVGEPAQSESLDVLARDAGWGCAADDSPISDASLARETLQLALQQLSADDREILTLRELDGVSGEETAQLLQLSPAAMKSRLHRARLRLAAALGATPGPAKSAAGGSASHA